MLLGDVLKAALSSVGITEERVSRLVGGACGCGRRQQQLNALDNWLRRRLRGADTDEESRAYVEIIFSEGEEE